MSKETTFTNYHSSQASSYLKGRGQDNDNLFNVITSTHRAHGGRFDTLLDLGCGPGNSTRPLARFFDAAYGRDTSPAMIEVAQEMEGKRQGGTRSGQSIDFKVHSAEEALEDLKEKEEQVDVITAGMAAHWFDLPKFWAAVPGALRSGGLVALWQYPSLMCFHPSVPHAKEANQIVARLIADDCAEYELAGNKMCRQAYHHFPLPWDLEPPVTAFRQEGYQRLEWDMYGELSDGQHFFVGDRTISMGEVYESLVTNSMVTRWREAHKDLVGTDNDPAVKAFEEIKRLIGMEEVIVGRDCVLLMFNKS